MVYIDLNDNRILTFIQRRQARKPQKYNLFHWLLLLSLLLLLLLLLSVCLLACLFLHTYFPKRNWTINYAPSVQKLFEALTVASGT